MAIKYIIIEIIKDWPLNGNVFLFDHVIVLLDTEWQ